MKKRICYSCVNINHFITSFILASTTYAGCENIILLCNYHRDLFDIYLKLRKDKGPFDNIISIGNDINCLKGIIHRVKPNDLDALHYFTFAFYNKNLLQHFSRARTDIVLTEEGLTTYGLEEILKDRGINQIGMHSFTDVLCMHPELIKNKRVRVKELDIINLLNNHGGKKIVGDIAMYIGFQYKNDYANHKAIFFDQPFSQANLITDQEEQELLKTVIMDIIRPDNLVIKCHPSDDISKFTGLGCQVFDSRTPWEYVVLYEKYMLDKVYDREMYTYYSGAIANTMRILKKLGIKSPGYLLYGYLCKRHKVFDKDIIHYYLSELVEQPDIDLNYIDY